MKQRKRISKGFTLVELLVVLIIIGALSAMLMITVTRAADRARAAAGISNARQIATAANCAAVEWDVAGRPVDPSANYINACKKRIEQGTVSFLGSELGQMNSQCATNAIRNVVEVAVNPVGGAWTRFKDEVRSRNIRNYARIWMIRDGYYINTKIVAVYYVSADGKYAVRIGYSDNPRLGSAGMEWSKL